MVLGGAIGGEEDTLTIKHALEIVLRMVGSEMERQLQPPKAGESGPGNMFGGNAAARNRSKGDGSLVRLAASRVLRQGLSEVATEPMQLTILHDLISMVAAQDQIVKDPTKPAREMPLIANQLQVVLIEISHLFSTLGEAAASTVPDFIGAIGSCLSHRDHGVLRHEAAIACEAFASCFPSDGRKLLRESIDEIQVRHAEMVTLATSTEASAVVEQQTAGGLRRFMMSSNPVKETQPTEQALSQQYVIHGRSLMVSLLIRGLPRLHGGLPTKLLGMAISVAEILASSQYNESLTAANPGGACMCVRAGFAIIAGALATGSAGAASHMPVIFGFWQKACKSASLGTKNFHARHDLFCLDGVLTSIDVFLKFCSELLLSIPEALSQVTSLLEESLKLLLPTGRLGSIPLTPPILARMESAVASLLECFAWLPSGSFPMAADDVFALAAQQIRLAVENEVPCSILYSLVNKEDSILDSKSWSRASRDGQVGGERDLEVTMASLTCEAVLHGEREAVIHLTSPQFSQAINDCSKKYLGSAILGVYASESVARKVPTPLHEVGGCWRSPLDPSCSSKVRLADAAIQAYSTSFGLKSGKEQQQAMDMLESMVPPLLAQLARTLGINAVLTEPERRPKVRDYCRNFT